MTAPDRRALRAFFARYGHLASQGNPADLPPVPPGPAPGAPGRRGGHLLDGIVDVSHLPAPVGPAPGASVTGPPPLTIPSQQQAEPTVELTVTGGLVTAPGGNPPYTDDDVRSAARALHAHRCGWNCPGHGIPDRRDAEAVLADLAARGRLRPPGEPATPAEDDRVQIAYEALYDALCVNHGEHCRTFEPQIRDAIRVMLWRLAAPQPGEEGTPT